MVLTLSLCSTGMSFSLTWHYKVWFRIESVGPKQIWLSHFVQLEYLNHSSESVVLNGFSHRVCSSRMFQVNGFMGLDRPILSTEMVLVDEQIFNMIYRLKSLCRLTEYCINLPIQVWCCHHNWYYLIKTPHCFCKLIHSCNCLQLAMSLTNLLVSK